MVNIPCDYCGSPVSTIVDTECNCSCVNCYQQFYTCRACEMGSICEFETNPSSLPKVVSQTIRQGPAVLQTQVKNPQRIEEFCHKCLCWNTDEGYCGKEDLLCKKYHEIHPTYREPRPENI